MASVWRTLVVWLMALAIPLQGVAAFATPACLPGHAPTGSAGVGVHASGHALHGAEQARTPMTLSSQRHAASDTGPVGTAAMGHDPLTCCSATCTMAVLGAMPTLQSAPAPTVAPLHPLDARYRGVTLAGLDRPPKTPLA